MSGNTLPTLWASVSLDSVAEIIGGGTPARNNPAFFQGDVPWATPTDVTALNDLWISDTAESISEQALINSSAKLLPPGTVLMTSRATIGFTAIAVRPLATNQGFANLVCNDSVLHNEYLAYWLPSIRTQLLRIAAGTTFKEISKSNLAKLEIPLPPLSEQKRIVAILREADELRRERRRANERAGDLLPALLHNILADKRNKLGNTTLSSLATTAYGTSKKASEDADKGVPVLRIPNVVSGRLSYQDMKYVELNRKELQSLLLDIGDVLVVRSNGNPDYVGRATAYINDGVSRTYASYLIRIRVDREQIDPEFLADYLNQSPGRSQLINRISTSAGQNNVNSQALAAIEVPLLVKKARQKYIALRADILAVCQ